MPAPPLPPKLAQGWVLVDFHATWCGPCTTMEPVIDAIADRYRGELTVAKVDVDRSPHVASAYGVSAMPTLVLFHDGVEVARLQGARGLRELQSWIDAARSR